MESVPFDLAFAARLDRWSAPKTWCFILTGAVLLRLADTLFPGVGLGPLYTPLIALATWRLGAGWGGVVMAGAILINAASMVRDGDGGTTGLMLARGLVRLSSYAIVILIVTSARRAYKREQAAARRDAMTGALNRMAYEDRLKKILLSAATVKRTLLIANIDLDDFKAINDRFGHASDRSTARQPRAVPERRILFRVHSGLACGPSIDMRRLCM